VSVKVSGWFDAARMGRKSGIKRRTGIEEMEGAGVGL